MPLAEAQGRWVASYLRGRVPPARSRRDARRHRARAQADVQALRGLQAPHDAGRLRQLPVGAAEGAQGAAPSAPARPASRCPVGAARPRPRRPSPRERRRTGPPRGDEGAQPRGDPRRGARGVRRARVRRGHACATSSAAPASPRARSTTTSPTRRRCFRALLDESARRAARPPARRARRGATSRGVRRGRLPRVLRLHRRGPDDVRARCATTPGTIRALLGDPLLGAGVDELLEDLAAAIGPATCPAFDADYMAAAMAGVGFEVGTRMVEREPVDVDGRHALRHRPGARRRRRLGRRLALAQRPAAAATGRRARARGWRRSG